MQMRNDHTYHVLGVPLRTGSLYPGSENIDVLSKQDMPAAYFPHTDGLSMTEARELLAAILADPGVRIIEVAEYASLRDLDLSYASAIVGLLAAALKRPGHLHTNGS
jgi:arginase family enzyme